MFADLERKLHTNIIGILKEIISEEKLSMLIKEANIHQ